MTRRQVTSIALSLMLLGASGASAAALAVPRTEAPEPTVPCDEIVLRSRTGVEEGARVLLGAVSVPADRDVERATRPTRTRTWTYFRHAGIAVRGGAIGVAVAVPEGWRDRVALSWGARPPSSTLRFARCGADPGQTWNAYSGGFYLRSRADCIPLLVRVGGTSTTIRLGLGRACGGRG